VVASLAALGSVIAASSCCLPLLPFLIITLVWPERVLALFYGRFAEYPAFASELRILVVAHGINYLAVALSAFVSALEESKLVFVALLISALSSVVVGTPLIARRGVAGAAVALLVGGFIRVNVLMVSFGRAGSRARA